MVHSSLSRFGEVEEGAYAVIDAIMDVVGPDGTILFPTFNQGWAPLFDRRVTPSYDGRISETFWHLPGVIRGNHPTHAYAALGPDAQKYTVNSHRSGGWSFDSPLGRLIADGGWILLLGVSQGTSTAQHHGESAGRVKCFGFDTSGGLIVDDEGEITATVAPTWRSGSCPYTRHSHEARMRRLGAVRDTHIGGAHIQLMRGSETVKAVSQLVRGETGVDHCATCDQYPNLHFYDEAKAGKYGPFKPSKWDPRPAKKRADVRKK